MGWPELRKSIGAILPDFMNEERGWPTPENPEFWEVVDFNEEMELFLLNQVRKHANAQEKVRVALGVSYNLLMTGGREKDSPAVIFEKNQDMIFSSDAFYLIFTGPMQAYILDRLGVPRHQQKTDFATLLLEDNKEALESFDPGEKALVWWTTWAYASRFSRHPKAKSKRETINLMVQLGINPPQVM